MSEYMKGWLLGFGLVLVIALVIYLILRKKGSRPCKYDERQELARGRAFKAGFFTLLIAGVLVALAEDAMPLPGDAFLWHFGVLLLGTAVFVMYAIHYDAYVSMTESPRKTLILGSVCATVLAVCAVIGFLSDPPGERQSACVALMVCVLWIVVLAALLIHGRKKRAEEEE